MRKPTIDSSIPFFLFVEAICYDEVDKFHIDKILNLVFSVVGFSSSRLHHVHAWLNIVVATSVQEVIFGLAISFSEDSDVTSISSLVLEKVIKYTKLDSGNYNIDR